jgi:hypothetical protein
MFKAALIALAVGSLLGLLLSSRLVLSRARCWVEEGIVGHRLFSEEELEQMANGSALRRAADGRTIDFAPGHVFVCGAAYDAQSNPRDLHDIPVDALQAWFVTPQGTECMVVHDDPEQTVTKWRRRFPEAWWGHFYRPEVWGVMGTLISLGLCSVLWYSSSEKGEEKPK